ncbi:asparagine synthetase B [Brumimicrobium aurantiacum]|uniref:Asparagine synthetase B n=1 Tax=Brumimicrobium aurantiacum TaxID=1737063 RepID=A0A3E1EXY1_9FLAO|nr:asparagine synthetase B [Brumimicrobium aurantiacum]RFC54420.1 asparagine synthetase B [Brumimicrobium aurantiacum]
MRHLIVTIIAIFIGFQTMASQILVPMDKTQANHLKAYGIAYFVLENGVTMEWLLNYRGGSFLIPHLTSIENELVIRGVSYEIVADGQVNTIKRNIASPEVNQEVVQLEVAPKIAVYTPGGKQPWDDAVTLVMEYAEIPYDKVYDSTVVTGGLKEYDWLHLHHEDFTGQYGKFYAAYRNAPWYREQVAKLEASAQSLGFAKVSDMKLAVAETIKAYVNSGGFLFTMCSGTDSFDIALAAHKTDIAEQMFDGDGMDPNYKSKLDFNNSLAFEDYQIKENPMEYEYSTIDGTDRHRRIAENDDVFTLFEFSAKWDVVPTMLTQNHTSIIKNFYGQTTDFVKEYVKPSVTIMGESKSIETVKYVHGELGIGTWTFYGGHDPEDYQHRVGDPHTDLTLHPNSPGYRLILNNVLFPAAKKKKRKT